MIIPTYVGATGNTMFANLAEFWRETSIAGHQFHPADEPIILGMKHALPAGRIPEPWFGTPSGAKVFYLTFNPGHVVGDGSDAEPWRGFCRAMMREEVDYPSYLRSITPAGLRWFQRNHGAFAGVTFPWICNLRLVPYPSTEKASLGAVGRSLHRLHSVIEMKNFVHRELVPRARDGQILLLAMRAPDAWGFGTPVEDTTDNGLFISRPLRNASISPTSRVGDRIRSFLLSHGVNV